MQAMQGNPLERDKQLPPEQAGKDAGLAHTWVHRHPAQLAPQCSELLPRIKGAQSCEGGHR